MYYVRVFNAHRVEPQDGSARLATAEETAQALQDWMNEVSQGGRLNFQTGYEYPFNAGFFMAVFRD